MFCHEEGNDNTGWSGQAHVTVDNNKTSTRHCPVDELSGPMKISKTDFVMQGLAIILLDDLSTDCLKKYAHFNYTGTIFLML